MHMPLLSEADPSETSEGSLDPLGLYPLADELGLKLVPGVRERQSRPRFLTSIAVSLHVCAPFDPEQTAKDGTTEPWLVFEWLLAEGLVRSLGHDPQELIGLPGSQKVRQAIRDGVSMSTKRYLKTPSVFGFHGVYRLLAKTLDIESHGRLSEQGRELLSAWSEEQALPGFLEGTGDGATWLKLLRGAVQDGLDKGFIDKKPQWRGWDFFGEHLSVYGVGKREAKTMQRMLLSGGTGFRRQVLEFVASKEGDELLDTNEWSERRFHTALKARSGDDLATLLEAIEVYESFSRLMHDAFEDCLFELSNRKQRVGSVVLAEKPAVRRAAESLPRVFPVVRDRLGVINASSRFVDQFGQFFEPMGPKPFVETLLKHHETNQKRKPPHGKAAWFDRYDDGSVAVRPAYLRETGAIGGEEYVHRYRTGSLWMFAHDLKLV